MISPSIHERSTPMIPKLAEMGLEIRLFEPAQATQNDWVALTKLFNIRRKEAWPDDPPRPVESTIKNMSNIPEFVHFTFWWIWDGDKPIAYAEAGAEIGESNQHLGWFGIYVHPAYRGKKIAGQLLRLIVPVIEDENRTLVHGWSSSSVPAGGTFLERLGGKMGLQFDTNQLNIVDVDHALMQSWVDRAAERAADLELGLWDGLYPEDEYDAILAMQEIMNSAPTDELDVEDWKMTVEHLRESEASFAKRDTTRWTLYARDVATGDIAGYTQIYWDLDNPENAGQGDTGVSPKYRQRGIGRWLKAAMIQRVIDKLPQVKRIRTGNATSNDAMLKINHEMGFKLVHNAYCWEIDLEQLQTFVNRLD
ncbi:GNAT family N-acetyltransferase [Chloroflexi bacterium TSY]|nr:GNAT family N-acetyltransferase [Chloroflexi bacterium TSY]